MESLYNWMLENGYDPAIIPYVAAGIAVVILIVMMRYLKGDKTETVQEAVEEKKVSEPPVVEAPAVEKAVVEEVAEVAVPEEKVEARSGG